jgi:hypothetical protein
VNLHGYETCDRCDEHDSYVCPEHRKTTSEILDEEGGVGTLMYYALCDEDAGGFASKVYGATKAAEAIYAEGLRRGATAHGALPTKPTSKAWNLDARALLEMGAKSIDAATVRGVVEELDKLRAVVGDKLAEIYEGPCITDADDGLQRVLSEIDGES